MALANGAKTYKLKYGHRGGNHPVKDLSNRPCIHFFTEPWLCSRCVQHWIQQSQQTAFVNVNDGTNEGLAYVGKNIFTVQFHPEACPGPQDSGYLFDRFMDMMEEINNA